MDFNEFRTTDQPEMSLTLKYLLENPALLQPPETSEGKEKCKDDEQYEQNQQGDLTSAYLGPQIWSDMLLSDDLKLEPVELDELLQTTGVDDEMSDLGLLMSSTSSVSPADKELQHRSSVSEDPTMVNYQDMPSLMSTGSPDAKQIPSPSDYFQPAAPMVRQNTNKNMVQPNGHRVALQFQQQIQQCHQLGGPQTIEQQKLLEQQLCDQQFAIFSDIMASNQYKNNQLSQPALQMVGTERVHLSSANLVSQQALPPPPEHMPLQQPVMTPPQAQKVSSTLRKRSSTAAELSIEGPLEKETRYSPATSPITPIEVRIPSPKKVNFVPNSTDMIISTPKFYPADSTVDKGTEKEERFDPSTRRFTEDELKPQPIIRKSKKVHVHPEDKDGKYWTRRTKNNVAAKRSREARRIKENQIAMRANYLEQENMTLKSEVAELRKELTRVVDVVRKYEKMFPQLRE